MESLRLFMPKTAKELQDEVVSHADLGEYLRRNPPVDDSTLDDIIRVLRAERVKFQGKMEK